MKEEDLEIFLEDFCDFLDGLEASIVKMKRQIAKLVGVAEKEKWGWNPDAIKWVESEGFKGKSKKLRVFDLEQSNTIFMLQVDEHGFIKKLEKHKRNEV